MWLNSLFPFLSDTIRKPNFYESKRLLYHSLIHKQKKETMNIIKKRHYPHPFFWANFVMLD